MDTNTILWLVILTGGFTLSGLFILFWEIKAKEANAERYGDVKTLGKVRKFKRSIVYKISRVVFVIIICSAFPALWIPAILLWIGLAIEKRKKLI